MSQAPPRNKTDAELRALAEKGGVFGIYDLFYLAPSPRQPNIDDYITHMAHALDVCGEDHVGIGSDASFDSLDLSPEGRANWDRVLADPAGGWRDRTGRGPNALYGRSQPSRPNAGDCRRAIAPRLSRSRGGEGVGGEFRAGVP